MTRHERPIGSAAKGTRMRHRELACILSTAVFALFAAASRAQPADDQHTRDLRARLTTEMDKRQIPGLQMMVIDGDRTVCTQVLGFADLRGSEPIDDRTAFSLNSMTKAFTGVAILQLQERGLLRLDDSIGEYLTDIPPSWRTVTIRQLLTHTSGLPDFIDPTGTIPGMIGPSGLIVGGGGEADAWRALYQRPLEFKAGDQLSYNQTGYALLGRIIATLSHQPFDQFVMTNQVEIAGMGHTYFSPSTAAAKGFAGAYMLGPAPTPGGARGGALIPETDNFATFLYPAGGLVSTAGDLARWIAALESGALLKRSESLKSLWTPIRLNNGVVGRLMDGEFTGYALGWQVSKRHDYTVVGAVGGNRSALLYYPDRKTAVILLTNRQGAMPETFMERLAKTCAPNLKIEAGGQPASDH